MVHSPLRSSRISLSSLDLAGNGRLGTPVSARTVRSSYIYLRSQEIAYTSHSNRNRHRPHGREQTRQPRRPSLRQTLRTYPPTTDPAPTQTPIPELFLQPRRQSHRPKIQQIHRRPTHRKTHPNSPSIHTRLHHNRIHQPRTSHHLPTKWRLQPPSHRPPYRQSRRFRRCHLAWVVDVWFCREGDY